MSTAQVSRRFGPCGPAQPVDAQGRLCLSDMQVGDLDGVMAIEQVAYTCPWTRGNFTDSLAAGYRARLLSEAPANDAIRPRQAALVGYSVAMQGVEETHLLNITVSPAHQGRGHARLLLADLVAASTARGDAQVWLEVRVSNERARSIYRQAGIVEIGRRKAYYPNGPGSREDACVMRLTLSAASATLEPFA